MSKTHTIITIGRQFGSGGREIGKRLADELEIEFYDKELLSRAAKDSKICKELFETHEQFSLFIGNGYIFYGICIRFCQ